MQYIVLGIVLVVFFATNIVLVIVHLFVLDRDIAFDIVHFSEGMRYCIAYCLSFKFGIQILYWVLVDFDF